MTPTEVMQATQTALSFWVDQKVYEFVAMGHRQKQLADQQKAAEEHIKSKLQEAEDQCNAMEAEQQQINKKIDVAEKEKLKVSEELERLRCEVAAAEDRHSRLQRQVVGEQRQDLFRRPLLEEPSPSTALLLILLQGGARAGRFRILCLAIPRFGSHATSWGVPPKGTGGPTSWGVPPKGTGGHSQKISSDHPPPIAGCPPSLQAFWELDEQHGEEFSNARVPRSSGNTYMSLQDMVRRRNLALFDASAPAAMMLVAKMA
eukprot:CAMPEP_0172676488 /NCGR_PEP_ID=MMETSP1074-20121228/14020_1 /TAXON_ID=2916 /ORGANISM="Ceratium fusus, Strain PA161109" /LENGTH=259 /DNA_ID=CAMNT_0013494163 /DNA_START=318 /DNA_END=1094 /DNA_ORIENTATION=-